MTYQEQKDFEVIDEVIETLENQISQIDKEMLENATNSGKLNELAEKKKTVGGRFGRKDRTVGLFKRTCRKHWKKERLEKKDKRKKRKKGRSKGKKDMQR